jgi:drug/metabolite transporter (DMT)-like permease
MESSTERSHLPLLAAVVSIILWAAAFVGIRAAGRSFSPGALALGRLTIGSVLLGGSALANPTIRPTRRELALLVLAGIMWFGTYQIVLSDAERRVDAGTAAMLVLIAPIFIMALAAVFLKERATPNLLLGAGVAFAGVVLIGLATSSRSASLLGVVLCLIAALASSIGVVAEKPVLRRMSAMQVTWTCCTVGAVCCVPYAPLLVRELRAAPAGDTAWLVFLGVFPTSIAYTTWAYALARGSAGRLAATAYLIPPITIVISWLVLGEVPRTIAVLGGALCLVGVVIARRVSNVSVVDAEEVRADGG